MTSPFLTGVARAIKILSAMVTVRPPADMVRQRSSNEALSAMDTNGPSSVATPSPRTDSAEAAASGLKCNSTQVVTAHDNGQVQVWDMSTGFLQPVLRMGVAGPSARSAFFAQVTEPRLRSNCFISEAVHAFIVCMLLVEYLVSREVVPTSWLMACINLLPTLLKAQGIQGIQR